jgi:hypothetical protein
MRAEYRFNYRRARPNRFAARRPEALGRRAARMAEAPLVVLVDPDIAEVFTTPKSVNRALCTLIRARPRKAQRKVLTS